MALKCEGQLGKLLHWPRDILPAASNHLNAWHQHSAVVAAVQASGKHVPSVVPERAEAEPALPDLLHRQCGDRADTDSRTPCLDDSGHRYQG